MFPDMNIEKKNKKAGENRICILLVHRKYNTITEMDWMDN